MQTIFTRAFRPIAHPHLLQCLVSLAMLVLAAPSTRAMAQGSAVSAETTNPSSPARAEHPRVHIRVPGSEPSSSGGGTAPKAGTAKKSPAAPGARGGSTQQPEVSKGELKARRDFDLLDFNGDGYLSRDEVALFPQLARAFDEADTNHDKRISFEEVRAFAIRYRAQRDRERQRAKDKEQSAKPASAPAPQSPSGH